MFEASSQTDFSQQVLGPGDTVGMRRPKYPRGKRHVFNRIELREQMISLEDESNVQISPVGQFLLIPGVQVGSIDKNLAVVRKVQSGKQMEQGALPRAGSPLAGPGRRRVALPGSLRGAL